MNIEEARKHLKKNLNNWKKSKKDNGYMPEIVEEINTDYEAIETLLTAYEKQSKEIEEMKKQLDLDNECEIALNSKIMDLEKEIEELNKSDASKEQSSMNYYNLYKELVDKIKAKIEFIKSLKEKFYYEENVISILQSLLEKE